MRKNMIKKFTTTALSILTVATAVPAIGAYAKTTNQNVSNQNISDQNISDQNVTSSVNLSTNNMNSVAEKVQKAFDQKDINALADLCEFPLAIVYNTQGEGGLIEVKNKDEFMTLEKDNIFSQVMLTAIAETNVANLEDCGLAGVWMGNDYGLNMFKFNGLWKVNSLVLDTNSL